MPNEKDCRVCPILQNTVRTVEAAAPEDLIERRQWESGGLSSRPYDFFGDFLLFSLCSAMIRGFK